MKRKNFFTGSVFQFYVPEIGKYAFCKFFDFKHLSEFHGLLARVFDKFSDTQNNSIEDLKNRDWLFGPRSMHKWPDLKKDSVWKSLGVLSGADDDIVPDFKGVQSVRGIVEDESMIGPWFPIYRLSQRGGDCNYACVKHLERKILTTSSLGLVWRTGMEYCRINNLPVERFYDFADVGIRNMYLQMINVPIYSTIPKNIREKAICEQLD